MGVWKETMEDELDSLGIGKGKFVGKPSTHQTGTSIKSIDDKRTALPPGKRISKYNKVYYENRKNRSDMKDKI